MAVFPTGNLTIQGNTTAGLTADNGSTVRIIEGATITGNGTDVVLLFGSNGTFNGNTIGTITCDETVLLRGVTGVMRHSNGAAPSRGRPVTPRDGHPRFCCRSRRYVSASAEL